MGQMMQDKGNENIIGVLALGARAGLDENLLRIVADDPSLRLQFVDLRGQLLRFRRGSFGHGLKCVAFPVEDIVELRLQSSQLRAVAALDRALISRLVKKDGRLFKLIKEKDHCAKEQDKELHRHFHQRVEKQANAAGTERIAREIALHL